MYVYIIVTLIILYVLYMLVNTNNTAENYKSCCWNGCDNACQVILFKPEDLLIENPFKKPFSGAIFPQQEIYDRALKK